MTKKPVKNPEEAQVDPNVFISTAITLEIHASSKVVVNLQGTMYSIGFDELRSIKEGSTTDQIEKERALLWDNVHSEVDNQIRALCKK